jgi:hypothetical protein
MLGKSTTKLHPQPFFWWDWGLNLGFLYCLSHISVPLVILLLEPHLHTSSYPRDGVSGTIYLDWPRSTILPISASHIDRITGMSHWHLAPQRIFEVRNLYLKTTLYELNGYCVLVKSLDFIFLC